MANPLVQQGTLNRLKASVTVTDYPALNVTAAFLAKEAITLALEGNSVAALGTMTGVVNSPEPYQLCRCTIHLIRAQALASAWKTQMELNAILGQITIRPDSTVLGNFYLSSCSIQSVDSMTFAGQDPGFAVTVQGVYYVNSALWG